MALAKHRLVDHIRREVLPAVYRTLLRAGREWDSLEYQRRRSVRIVVRLSGGCVVQKSPRKNMAEAASELKLAGEVVGHCAVEFLADESSSSAVRDANNECAGRGVKSIVRVRQPPCVVFGHC